MPSGPVTEREAGVLVKETDGWKITGVFPILEVCPLTDAEDEKERMAMPTLCVQVRVIIVGVRGEKTSAGRTANTCHHSPSASQLNATLTVLTPGAMLYEYIIHGDQCYSLSLGLYMHHTRLIVLF